MTHLLTVLGYADYSIEVGLLVFLAFLALRGRGRGLVAILGYMSASVGVAALRGLALWRYGFNSPVYAAWYWATDFVIVSAVFLLICYFFRRASLEGAPKFWPHVRLMLFAVFVLTAAVASFIILHSHTQFYPYFILEFQDDVYFVCLVLATMLYLLVVQYVPADDQLGLLVAGLGIQCAGCAASLALFHVTGGGALYGVLVGFLIPLCDIGMTLIWLYTALRVPYRVAARKAQRAPRTLPVGQFAHIR
jgi:hypothetical protein